MLAVMFILWSIFGILIQSWMLTVYLLYVKKWHEQKIELLVQRYRDKGIRHTVTGAGRVPTHFQELFSTLFQYQIKRLQYHNLASFFENFIDGKQSKKLLQNCHSCNEQNLNKQTATFRISILFQYFVHILAKFNTFSRSWKLISKFNTFSTLSIPHGNPVQVWDRNSTEWVRVGRAWVVGRVNSLWVQGGSRQDFSNSCWAGVDKKLTHAGL